MGGQNPLATPNSGQGAQGLNEAFTSPVMGLAAGLLQSTQPSKTPQNVGGGLSRGLGFASEMQRQQQEMAMKQQEMGLRRGIAAMSETPEQKMQREIATNAAKLQQKENLKITSAIDDDLPHLSQALVNLTNMKNITNSNPNLFGNVWGNFSSYRNIPEVGKFLDNQQKIIALSERELSDRGSQQALAAATRAKAAFNEPLKVAQGKLDSAEAVIVNKAMDHVKRYERATGNKYVVIRGEDGSFNMISEEEYKRRGGK